MNRENFEQGLRAVAQALGAHSVACLRMDNPVLRACVQQGAARAAAWRKAGRHGTMEYLERMAPARADPWSTYPFARSVVVVTFTNRWGDPAAPHPFPSPAPEAPVGYLSAYARARDYHHTGHALLVALATRIEGAVRTEATVDTGPVDERAFAVAAGLGVYGGNGLLRVPGVPSVRVFIGCLFVDVVLPEVRASALMPYACASCQACVRACPTGALSCGASIDARRCIAYLTIEKRGVLSHTEQRRLGDWLFGCDACTTACPSFERVDARIPVDLAWLFDASAGEVRRLLAGGAAAYAGVTQLRRNAVAVLKNLDTPAAIALLRRVRDTSGSDLIRQQIDLS